MLRFGFLFLILSSQAFAHTECYFDNNLKDGTYGFFLEDHQITLMHPYSKYSSLEKSGNDLLLEGNIVGQLQMFFPRGVLELGQELSSFKCTVWRTGGHG